MYLYTQDMVDVSALLPIVITKANINDHTIVSCDFSTKNNLINWLW